MDSFARRNVLIGVIAALLLGVPVILVVAGPHPAAPAQAASLGPVREQPAAGVDWNVLRRRPIRPTPDPTATPSPAVNSQIGVPTVPPPVGALPAFSHVFLIVMENREYGSVIGNPAAPYVNGLAKSYTLASNYFAVSHPSLPNYLALAAGSTFGVSSDCTTCLVNATNIADQVEASGRSWKAYMEDMPAPCYLGAGSSGYAQKHNPFVYFTDIRNNPARCAAHVVPFTLFSTDLANGSLPNYVWITPNLCNDMHDCATGVGDAWLAGLVPQILASAAWRNGGVLFITWDEGSTSLGFDDSWGGRVATIVVSPSGRDGFQAWTARSHYNLLRTIEDAWGLGALGAARLHQAMREDFR
jgi:acid phosphatase